MPSERPPESPPVLSATDRTRRTLSLSLVTLTILGVLYTLYFARALILPVVLALLLSLLLTPLVRFLHRRIHLPPAVGSGVILLSLLAAIALATVFAVRPAADWIQAIPSRIPDIKYRLESLRVPFQQFTKVSEQVKEIASLDESPPSVAIATEGPLSGILMHSTPAFMANLLVMFILLYFLLASGDQFLRKVVRIIPRFKDKRRAVEIANDIESRISTYLQTVTLINLALGISVGIAAHFIGLPNAILWGSLAFFLNFIPYLGALLGIVAAFVVSLLTFESLGQACLLPAIYLGLNIIEGNFVTPFVLSRILTLNAVIVFFSIMFWTWLWGIPGALLAVPILATFKIVSDHVDFLKSIGQLIGEDPSAKRGGDLATSQASASD